jgi:hypothetical protein
VTVKLNISRRAMLGGAAAVVAAPVLAQHTGHGPMYERLDKPGRVEAPELIREQHVITSPAPAADNPGKWMARAPLPLPRSEMAWATVLEGKMHLVGGYGEQRVDRPYHHVYDPATDKWSDAPPLPRGANHVGVAVLDDKLYATGGFVEQNRKPDTLCFVQEGANWRSIAPLPRACGAIALVALGGMLHAVGGAIGDTTETKKSVDWHLAYDPNSDKWTERAPLPTPRDHTGTLAVNGLIHVVGGRVDSFHTNSNLHHTYDPKEDRWRMRNPMPTARSGHGVVLYRGQIFCMGGEGTNRVYGQTEAYEPTTDRWRSYAPMLTPRHGLGAVAIGNFIYVAGGGPVMGGSVQSAVHEAFTLG